MRDFFKFWKKEAVSINEVPITGSRFTIIDTELTGLNERKDSIVSIGAVKMTGTKIELGRTFHKLVRPRSSLKPESVVIHGITPSDVLEQPDVDIVIAEFLEFCDEDIVVGHCITIDLTFLNKEMKRSLGFSLRNPVLDTFSIYEWLRKKGPPRDCFASVPRDPALYEISKCFGIPVRGAHDALMDSFITAQLFQRFIPILSDAEITTLGRLLQIGTPYRGGDAFTISSEITNF